VNIDIKSEDVLDKVKERLYHLVECRDFIDAFVSCGLHLKLIERQAKSQWEHERGRFEKELKDYNDAYKTHALQLAERGLLKSHIDRWLVDVEHLERAERLVGTIYGAVGGGYNDLPNDPPHKFSSWIRSIRKFDDSE
jgi:hypothetical protein